MSKASILQAVIDIILWKITADSKPRWQPSNVHQQQTLLKEGNLNHEHKQQSIQTTPPQN